MNLSAIFSKTGKGVQEASGKTSHLSRADRAVLSAIDGKTPLSKVQENFEKLAGPKFEALITQLDKDGFIREVSSGAAAAPSARPAAPTRAAPPPPPPSGGDDDMDFTQAIKLPPKAPAAPKAPPVDLAAAGRAEAERKAKEAQALDYKARAEAEARAKAEADLKARAAQEARLKAEAESKARAEAEAKARAAAEAKGRADAEAKARAEAEAKARADADSKTRAEADAKVKAAREAAVRMATEAKAKAEADAKAKTEAAERDKAKLEAELNAKLDAERKAREEAEKRAAEAADQARRELEEKAKRDAEEMRQRLEAEMKAKLEAERKAREEEDRKRREEDDRRRKEEDERRAKEEAERRAREEADRKKREDEDRKRREDDERRRREDDERRAKEDAERRAREEEDKRRRKEEDERRALEDTNRKLEIEKRAKEDAERKAKEEAERRAKEDADRRAKEDADRRAKEDAERRAKEEAEAKARAAASASASLPKIEAVAPPPPPPAAPAGGGIGDDLLADLDSFGKREEEEQKAKEEAERKAKEEKARREKAEAERKAKEEADKKRREEEEKRRKEEEERRAKEEAERQEREEEERRKEEEAERKRKAKEAMAAKQAEERAAKAAAAGGKAGKGGGKASVDDDDIGVTDADLDLDDLKRDQKVAADKARKAAKEAPPVVVSGGRPKKWGKPAAIALFVLLIVGVGVLHVMPLSTAEYEKAASDAMGVPVKIGSARLSVITGIEVKFEGVSIGSAGKIRVVRGSPEVGSLFGARKSFSRVDLEGVSMTQAQIADALLGKVGGENLRIGRIGIKGLAMEGPLKMPPLDVEATVAGDGTLQSVKLTGADKLNATLSPRNGEIGFDLSAGSLAVPFVPALSLSDFAIKGTANAAGVTTSEFDGRVFDGVIKGSARIRWGSNWSVEGEIRANGLKAAVFAPTLVSDGRVEGRAAYSMAGSSPGSLYEGARLQGEFKIEKGVIGSFDLSRALQTGGASTGGRTVFNELTAQGLYDKGTVQITNATVAAGAMNAGLSLNIDANGGLSGRVVADVKTPSQTLRSTLNISGKVQDPVIRK